MVPRQEFMWRCTYSKCGAIIANPNPNDGSCTVCARQSLEPHRRTTGDKVYIPPSGIPLTLAEHYNAISSLLEGAELTKSQTKEYTRRVQELFSEIEDQINFNLAN